MTLEEAVAVLNRERHRLYPGGEWFIHTGRNVMGRSVIGNAVGWYTEFDAVAIAEKYERERPKPVEHEPYLACIEIDPLHPCDEAWLETLGKAGWK